MLIFVLQTLAEILAGGTSLTSTEQIDFSHPSNHKEEGVGPTLNLYIYDIRESKQMQHSGRHVERDLRQVKSNLMQGQVERDPTQLKESQKSPFKVKWSPTWFDVSILLTTWDRTAFGEYHLISEAITVLLRHRLLEEKFLVSELRGYGNLNMTVSVEPQLEAGSLWSALTVPLRPALYLMVTVPFEPEMIKAPYMVWERIFQMQNEFGNGSVETISKKVVIAGVVKSNVTNQPLVEAEIKLVGTEKSTSSSKEGLFYFENLNLGNYVLLLNCQGYLPLQVNVLVDGPNCNFKEILLTPA